MYNKVSVKQQCQLPALSSSWQQTQGKQKACIFSTLKTSYTTRLLAGSDFCIARKRDAGWICKQFVFNVLAALLSSASHIRSAQQDASMTNCLYSHACCSSSQLAHGFAPQDIDQTLPPTCQKRMIAALIICLTSRL